MGDHFRIIADPHASVDEAPILAGRVMDYLISRKIIAPERSDCTLGEEGGFRPGDNVAEVLARWTPPATPHTPLPLDEIMARLRRSAVNGVVDIVGRTVFHNSGAGLDAVRCPLCVANNIDSDWGDAVGHWYRGDDPALLQCRSCNEKSPLTEWTFDPPWAFGNLGFEFWNWPPVRRSFIDKISAILGHKVVLICGKV